MTKKFTEEQYREIVEIGNQYHDNRIRKTEVLILDYMCEGGGGFNGGNTEPLDQAMAIANPLTREWAHDKFVEKEKKYVWTSKNANSSGRHKRLFWQMSSKSVRDYFTIDENYFAGEEQLTESEIKSWGYNPEMFDKE